MRPDTTLILAICALLIVNSHLEAFYPAGLQFLAADGLLGNSLFFLLSGFGIQSSLMNRRQEFGSFMRRRIMRIYPALFIVVSFTYGLLGGGFSQWSATDYLNVFIWPTDFTYVRLITLFYAAGYLLFLPRSARVLVCAIVVLWAVYFWFYVQDYPSLPADANLSLGHADNRMANANYASLFCLGMWLATLTPNVDKRRRMIIRTALVTILLAYFSVKYLMVVLGWHSNLYPALHILVFVAAPLSMAALCDPQVISELRSVRPIWICVSFVGALTLEFYLIHASLISTLPFASIAFPLNIALLLGATSVLAYAVHLATRYLRPLPPNDTPSSGEPRQS